MATAFLRIQTISLKEALLTGSLKSMTIDKSCPFGYQAIFKDLNEQAELFKDRNSQPIRCTPKFCRTKVHWEMARMRMKVINIDLT